MLTYLARVEKRRQIQSWGRVQILAVRGANGLWTECKETIILPQNFDRFDLNTLVLVQLNDSRQITKIELANDLVVRSLIEFSKKTGDLKEQWQEIELWRNSLNYQAIELHQRQENLERREDLLKLKEEAIANFNNLRHE